MRLFAIFLLCFGVTKATPIDSKLGDFSKSKNPKALPVGWRIKEGKKADIKVWEQEEQSGFILPTDLKLTRTINFQPLTEKESKAGGEWTTFLGFDSLKSPGKAQLTLSDDQNKIVASILTTPSKSGRLWAEISPEKTAQLFGKKLTLQLAISGGGVLSQGVHLCRINSKPGKHLFGRSNGGLGPDKLNAGSLGFSAMTEHAQTILPVMEVRKRLAADKAGLKPGDRIIEVNRQPLPINDLKPGWDWFHHSHEATLGRAVLAAASPQRREDMRNIVELGVLRKGKLERLHLKVPRAMNFSNLDPGKDKTADVLHQDLIAYLVKNQRPDGSWSRDPIRTTFSALALMATRDTQHTKRIKKAVDYLLNRYPEAEKFGNLGFWHSAYAGILYSEYYLASGDDRVLGRMQDIRDWALTGTHTSKWGMPALGHGIGGLPYGQKALIAPLAHLIVFEALAKRCGMKSKIWEELTPYIEHSWSDPKSKNGHGAMGYNASYKDLGEFWSRSGLCAIACELRGERPDMRDALTKIMHERHPWIRNSHAYGEPGGALGLLALNLTNQDAYRDVIKQYAWWFALAWEPGYGLRFSTPHMGAPYMGEDDLVSATYALVLAAPNKTLHLTGAKDSKWMDVSALTTPVSPVRIKRSRDGLVSMEGTSPGNPVHYTVDGSEPTKESLKFQKPFPFDSGKISALVIDKVGNSGPINSKTFGPAPAKWKIITASGHSDPAEAIRRASRSIDGDRNKCWLTDMGEGTRGYPHHLVIDFGEARTIKGVKIHFADQKRTPSKWSLKGSQSTDQSPLLLGEKSATSWEPEQTLKMDKEVKLRYLRFEAVNDGEPDKKSLFVREIEIL